LKIWRFGDQCCPVKFEFSSEKWKNALPGKERGTQIFMMVMMGYDLCLIVFLNNSASILLIEGILDFSG